MSVSHNTGPSNLTAAAPAAPGEGGATVVVLCHVLKLKLWTLIMVNLALVALIAAIVVSALRAEAGGSRSRSRSRSRRRRSVASAGYGYHCWMWERGVIYCGYMFCREQVHGSTKERHTVRVELGERASTTLDERY